MCLIIVQPPQTPLPDSSIRNGCQANADGSGYMFVSAGRVVIRKGFTTADSLLLSYHKDYRNYRFSYFVLHMRIGTSGRTDAENCHPFLLERHGIGFCHNGILSQYTRRDSPLSDTRHFADEVLERLPAGFLSNPAILQLLDGVAAGTSSKFAFLLPSNQVVISNERAGVWVEGIWYSNDTYKESRRWGFSDNWKHWRQERQESKPAHEEEEWDVDFCEECGEPCEAKELTDVESIRLCPDCAHVWQRDGVYLRDNEYDAYPWA